ncbi:MAG TPA: glycosyltransferase [Gemmatimonadaceae bacterium]|nr:glycosyltransferase [Gemmatimonadaceae bacterium]
MRIPHEHRRGLEQIRATLDSLEPSKVEVCAAGNGGTKVVGDVTWARVTHFDDDCHPGRPRILFIGQAESTHAHAWVDLLAGADINVRMFALPGGVPPDSWEVRTYVSTPTSRRLDSRTRRRLYPAGRLARAPKRAYARLMSSDRALEQRWLAQVIREWKPNIVHTLGLDPAGEFYYDTRKQHGVEAAAVWVAQTRGGSDLSLARYDEARASRLGAVLRASDCILSDNAVNFEIARDMGVATEQLSPIGTVPGTGGVDIDALHSYASGRPSSRSVIVWPKAYECPWSKALPVFQALVTHWDRLPPCELHLLAMEPETRMWFHSLPGEIRQACHIEDRIPRHEVLQLMGRARVMLAPSLVDGTPNSMFEAMATGALPILSPLDTIRPLVRDGSNVLFARNLYPDEIGEALVRAMHDDVLVDSAADRNLALVRQLADRSAIRPRVVALYESLAAGRLS